MRKFIDLVEGKFGVISSRYGETPVYKITSRRELDGFLRKFGVLRGMLNDQELLVWDAEQAAHMDFEKQFGAGDDRIMIMPGEIEYNVNQTSPEEILANPVIQRLYSSEELQALEFGANEV